MKKKLIIFFIIGSLGMILYALIEIGWWVKDNRDTQKLMNSLKTDFKKEIFTDNIPDFLVEPPSNQNDSYWKYVASPFLEVDFTDLIKRNPDTVAWINIPNTNIDYPIVQGLDNTYYLTHSFDNSENKAGWLFMDVRNDIQNLGKNTIIYGHRRLDNIMFGDLIKLLDKNWFLNDENHLIKISTLKENLVYQIFSVYTILKENYYIKTTFKNNEYIEFLDTIKKRSYYDFNTLLSEQNSILTLSTCYDNNGKRLVVHAKLIKKETR